MLEQIIKETGEMIVLQSNSLNISSHQVNKVFMESTQCHFICRTV